MNPADCAGIEIQIGDVLEQAYDVLGNPNTALIFKKWVVVNVDSYYITIKGLNHNAAGRTSHFYLFRICDITDPILFSTLKLPI